jgi:hypothetical protein
MGSWLPILVLGLTQFVMVLDGTVMNVSINAVVIDLGTTVSAMQLAIATFTLSMGAFMLAGAGLEIVLIAGLLALQLLRELPDQPLPR